MTRCPSRPWRSGSATASQVPPSEQQSRTSACHRTWRNEPWACIAHTGASLHIACPAPIPLEEGLEDDFRSHLAYTRLSCPGNGSEGKLRIVGGVFSIQLIPLGMVQGVKCICAEFHMKPFIDLKGLSERKIEIVLPWTSDRPKTRVSASVLFRDRELRRIKLL